MEPLSYSDQMKIDDVRREKEGILYVTNLIEIELMKRYFHKDKISDEEFKEWTELYSPKFREAVKEKMGHSDPLEWTKNDAILKSHIEEIEAKLLKVKPVDFDLPDLDIAA